MSRGRPGDPQLAARRGTGAGPAAAAGFSIVFDPQTQFVGADVLFGGSPPRLLRLNPAGQRALRELRRGPVFSAAAGKLARRLTDTGLAHPRPPAPGGPARDPGGAGGRPPERVLARGASGSRRRWPGGHAPAPAWSPW